MIRTNVAAEDYEFRLDFTATSGVANPQYAIVEISGTLNEGYAYVTAKFDHKPPSNAYALVLTTLFGSLTLTPASFAYGYARFYFKNLKIVKNADCTFVVSWDALDVYHSFDGAAEVHDTSLTTGVESESLSGYDERINVTTLTPVLGVGSLTDPTCTPTIGTWTDSVSVSRGYRHGPTGFLVADAIAEDGTVVSGTCPCTAAVAGVGGADSFSGSVTISITSTMAQDSPTVISCPSCTPSTYSYIPNTQATTVIENPEAYLSIHAQTPNMGPQSIVTTWTCVDPSGFTSGGGTTTTTPGSTTCASKRSVTQVISTLANCHASRRPICPIGVSCGPLPGTVQTCTYNATAELMWPSAPPCGGSSIGLAYDVSRPQRHARAYIDGGTGHLFVGIASNAPEPLVWVDADDGTTAIVFLRLRWRKLGQQKILCIFYALSSAGPLYYAESTNEGKTFGLPITITSGATYWALDLEWTASGLLYLYWLESDGKIYPTFYDNSLNVRKSRAATTLTGCDHQAIAVREGLIGGGFALGCFYGASGSLKLSTTPDGLNFSGATALVSAGTYWWLDFVWSNSRLIYAYWLESDGTIYRAVLDNTLNVRRSRAATSLVGVDNDPIAVSVSKKGFGGFRVGCLFSVGGVIIFETAASDGLIFA